MQGAGNESDAAMAEGGQMLYGLTDSFGIVDLEDANVWQAGAGVDKNEGKLALNQLLDQILFNAEGHDGDAVDVALEHAADERLGAFRLIAGGTDEDFVPLGDGEVFELLD